MSLDRVVTARAGLPQHPALLHELDAADIAARCGPPDPQAAPTF